MGRWPPTGSRRRECLKSVGILDPSTEGVDTTLKAYALRDAMRQLGWIDGQNVALKLKFANGSQERLASLAERLVIEKVDVIAAVGTDAALAVRRTTTIPIVMVGIADPVRAGLVENLGRPEGNTGVSLLHQELWGKSLAAYYVDTTSFSRVPSPVICQSNSRQSSELVVNLKTAKALGLTIPPSLLLRADQVIE